MNFDNKPELHWPWGYPALLAVMACVAVGIVLFSRRKGWLGGGDDEPGDPTE